MSKVSFKQFSSYVDLPEEATPEQLQEIFGMFKKPEEIEKLNKERLKLKMDQDKKKKELGKKKDEFWAQRARDMRQTDQAAASGTLSKLATNEE